MTRKAFLSITIDDCRVDTFTVGGHGGAGKDTSNTGVRIVHEPSGAVGQAVDHRQQSKNKQLAFRRMAEKPELIAWIYRKREEARTRGTLEERVNAVVDEQMKPENIRIEAYEDSKWVLLK